MRQSTSSKNSIVATFITAANYDYADVVKICTSSVARPDDTNTFDTITDLIESALYNNITKIYIHDFNYVSHYIYNWCLTNNLTTSDHPIKDKLTWSTLRDETGHVYYINIFCGFDGCTHELCIRSSRNKLMNSTKKLASSYLNIDVDISDQTIQLNSSDELNDKHIRTCTISSVIIASVLQQQLNTGYTSLTISTDGFKSWQKLDLGDEGIYQLTEEEDTDLRYAYRGGFTWCNPRFSGIKIKHGLVLDINSLYPFVMYKYPMPWGRPQVITEIPDSGYFVGHFYVTATLKPDGIPCISNMTSTDASAGSIIKNEYLTDIQYLDCWLTNFDLALLEQNYFVHDLQFISGYSFKTRDNLFKNYIEHWYDIKQNSQGAQRQTAKLFLDALYGRFGLRHYKHITKPVLDNNKLVYKKQDVKSDTSTRYLPLSLFITSIARYIIINQAHQVGLDKLIYVDTDSLHIVGTDIPSFINISNDLGCYKIESIFTEAKYLGLKTYIHTEVKNFNNLDTNIVIKDDDELVVKTTMSGASDTIQNQVTWDNFKCGTVLTGKTKISIVPGGCYRTNTKYTIVQCF